MATKSDNLILKGLKTFNNLEIKYECYMVIDDPEKKAEFFQDIEALKDQLRAIDNIIFLDGVDEHLVRMYKTMMKKFRKNYDN